MAWQDALAVLRDCEELDVKLSPDGGEIVARGWLTDSLRGRIHRHKSDLLSLLAEQKEPVERPRPSQQEQVEDVKRKAEQQASNLDDYARAVADVGDFNSDLESEREEATRQAEKIAKALAAAIPGSRVVPAETRLPPLRDGESFAVYFTFCDGTTEKQELPHVAGQEASPWESGRRTLKEPRKQLRAEGRSLTLPFTHHCSTRSREGGPANGKD